MSGPHGQVEQTLWFGVCPLLTVHLWPSHSLPSLGLGFPILRMGCAVFDPRGAAAWGIVLKIRSSGLGRVGVSAVID